MELIIILHILCLIYYQDISPIIRENFHIKPECSSEPKIMELQEKLKDLQMEAIRNLDYENDIREVIGTFSSCQDPEVHVLPNLLVRTRLGTFYRVKWNYEPLTQAAYMLVALCCSNRDQSSGWCILRPATHKRECVFPSQQLTNYIPNETPDT